MLLPRDGGLQEQHEWGVVGLSWEGELVKISPTALMGILWWPKAVSIELNLSWP